MNHSDKSHISAKTKISDIVLENPHFLLMLEHLEIKIQLKEKSIEQICIENGVNVDCFLAIASMYYGHYSVLSIDYSTEVIQTIIKILKNSHNYYLEEKYPQIRSFIKQMSKNTNFREAAIVEDFFNNYFLEVSEHLDYENNIVFPYILELDFMISNRTGTIMTRDYSSAVYKEQHDDIEEKLTDLKNLLVKYLPQKEDQKIRRQLLLVLFELEYSLVIHSKIEEKILIPIVEKMERLFKQS